MTDRLAAAIIELVEALREEAQREAASPTAAPDRLLDIRSTCEALSLGRSAVYGLIASGQLRTVRAGRRRLVPASAIDAFIEAAS